MTEPLYLDERVSPTTRSRYYLEQKTPKHFRVPDEIRAHDPPSFYPLSWMMILHEIDANLPCQRNVGGPELFVQGCREYAWV